MPLNKQVSFKTRLQRGRKLQVPKNHRVCYNLESTQMLKVSLNARAVWSGPQTFVTRIRKDGRIDIPKIVMELLSDKPLPENCILEVTLEPA